MEAVLSFPLSLFLLANQCTTVITALFFFSDLLGGQRPDKLYERFKENQRASAKVDGQEDARFHSYN